MTLSTLIFKTSCNSSVAHNLKAQARVKSRARARRHTGTSGRPRADRGSLTAKNAVEIYKMKKHETSKCAASMAASMAAKYSVTPKAVRDIWTHVTWTTATWPFWTTKHQLNYSLT